MPALGFGVFQTPPDETVACVAAALRVGYRLIDTAASYGNEREVGEGIRQSGLDRSEIFAETGVIPAVNRVEVHPYFSQPAVQAADADHGICTQAWSPMGGVTSYRGDSSRSTFNDPVIGEIARAHGKSPAQVMLRWHLQDGRSAIPKSVKPARLAANFDVFDFELTADELARIDALDTGVRGGPDPDSVTPEKFHRDIPRPDPVHPVGSEGRLRHSRGRAVRSRRVAWCGEAGEDL